MKISEDGAVRLTLAMHKGKPCRICGETIDNASDAVYAGYSKDNETSAAHKACWKMNIPQAQWVYPESDK